MFFDFIEKLQCGRYVRERAKNTYILYEQFKDPTSDMFDEEAVRHIIAASFELLKHMDFIDELKQDTDTYVERILSDAKNMSDRHNKPYNLQSIAIQMIGVEVAFMSFGKKWHSPKTIGRIVDRNVCRVIPNLKVSEGEIL